MVRVAVLDLEDPQKWNKWIIGTPEDVPKSSPFYSEQLQIKYNKNPDKEGFLEEEEEHWHSSPIEEFYFVLQGTLEVKVEDDVVNLGSMQILSVPPNKSHMVIDYSLPIQFFTIRAPISGEKTKIVKKHRSKNSSFNLTRLRRTRGKNDS
jgi:mannose-6-phosphate isomerase-like protein (cupin superfamily)